MPANQQPTWPAKKREHSMWFWFVLSHLQGVEVKGNMQFGGYGCYPTTHSKLVGWFGFETCTVVWNESKQTCCKELVKIGCHDRQRRKEWASKEGPGDDVTWKTRIKSSCFIMDHVPIQSDQNVLHQQAWSNVSLGSDIGAHSLNPITRYWLVITPVVSCIEIGMK